MTSLAPLIIQHWPEVAVFVLVFGRTMGLIVGAPFWGSRVVPMPVRVWVAVLLAVAVYPLAKVAALPADMSILSLFLSLSGEIFFGLMLGWLAQLFFAGIRLAGQEIEIKTGLSLIQLIDPHEGGQSGVFAAFLESMAGIVFFALNGHHLLIQALASSYKVFPLAGEKFLPRLAAGLIGSTGEVFAIALRVCAPVLFGLLLTDIVLGIISRAIPQMNVFMVSQPLQFAFGVVLLMLSMPMLVWFVARQLPLMIGVPGGIG